jgi:hypothetical protein
MAVLTADPSCSRCRAKAVVCKAQKPQFGQAAAAAAVATTLLAGVSGRKQLCDCSKMVERTCTCG